VEVDLDGWSVIRPEAGGRDENKDWMAETSGAPRSEHWLWKPRRMTGNGAEPAINDVAEVVTSRLADRLGIPAAECRYAVRDGVCGAISLNVTPPRHDLHNGDVFLSEVDGYLRLSPTVDEDGRTRGLTRLDEGYTLDAVEQVLEGLPGPAGTGDLTAFQVFTGYLVLDALVANTDRHPRNWAVLERRSDGARSLAPTFDHGTALSAGLTDDNRLRRDPRAFCHKGLANPFSPAKQSLVGLAHAAVLRSGTEVWLDRIEGLDDDTIREVVQSPESRLSEGSATFVEQILTINRGRLCDVDDDEN
jgi:hypothetical protein